MQYKRSKEGYNKIRNRTILVLILIVSVVFIVNNVKTNDTNVFLFTLGLFTLITAFALYRSLNKLKEMYYGYVLIFERDEVIVKQFGKPDTEMMYGRIQSITKKNNGSLVLQSAFDGTVIIPKDMDDFKYIENRLADIKPIDVDGSVPFFEKYKVPLMIVVFGAMILNFTQTNLIVVSITSLIVVPALVYSFFSTYKNKDIDPKLKRSMWWIWIVLFSIIGRLVMVILNAIEIY